MPKRFDLIVFDWDGTLADSTQMIVECIRQASAEAGELVAMTARARPSGASRARGERGCM